VPGQARLLLVLVAAALVAVGVWTWLPPTEASQDAMKQSILHYDLASGIAWPADRYAQPTLPKATRDALRAAWRATLADVAEGDAVASQLAFDPVKDLLAERRRQPDRIVVARGGEVVLFDVCRRTLHGALIVRAAVTSWVEAGTWDARRGDVVRVTRQEQAHVPIFEYTMRQEGGVWKVVDRAGPRGGPFFYDTTTGETTNAL